MPCTPEQHAAIEAFERALAALSKQNIDVLMSDDYTPLELMEDSISDGDDATVVGEFALSWSNPEARQRIQAQREAEWALRQAQRNEARRKWEDENEET